MAKLIIFVIIFFGFALLKLAIQGAKKATVVAKDAYDAVNNNETLIDSFNRMKGSVTVTQPEAIISMLTKIAKSDGVLSSAEADIISDVITHFVVAAQKHDTNIESYRRALINASKTALDNDKSIGFYANIIKNNSQELLEGILLQLIMLSTIDGYSRKKERMIYSVGEIFQMPESTIDMYINEIVGNEDKTNTSTIDPYEVLECSPSDDIATIKKKYRELVKKFHPDFIQGKNMHDDFIKMGTDKLREINEAYEIIKRERNF